MTSSDSAGPGFVDELLGPKVRESPWGRRFLTLRPDIRVALSAAALGTLIFIPYLGAVGLWDPWETHYGEVAREMIQRGDYVYPYWETAWFFSKPPLTMWMQALGMQVVGTNRTNGALALYSEWGMRLPFALYAILALSLLSCAIARLAGVRAGLATAFILATSPLYFLLTRQTVTDTPFVTSLVCAMACALIAQLDPQTRHRTAWWYGFYVFSGLAVLAKGLLGFLPGAVLLLYALACYLPYSPEALEAHVAWLTSATYRASVRAGERPMPALWAQVLRMRLPTGLATFMLVWAPWYLTLLVFRGVDDEGKTWFQRFIIHDHFNRIAAGVHTTTPGGTFSYFIEQAGYALFPWVALVPGALAVAARTRPRDPSPTEQLTAMTVVWAALAFFAVAISATKFHHYVFPVVPALAILMALFVDRLWREGVAAHAATLLMGFLLLVLVAKDLAEVPVARENSALYGGLKHFTDLFVYNYDRPYPIELLNEELHWFSAHRLRMGDVLAILLLAVGGYVLLEALRGERRTAGGRTGGVGLLLAGLAVLASVSIPQAGLFRPLAGAAIAAVVFVALELRLRGERTPSVGALAVAAVAGIVLLSVLPGALSADRLVAESQVATVLYQRLTLRLAVGLAFAFFITLVSVAAVRRERFFVFGVFSFGTLLFSLWFSWSHWVALSHHWTQRDLFWRYYDRRRPGEPIAAYLMNWKGETFYSRNTVRQIPLADSAKKIQLFAAPPGREWVILEHARLGALRSVLGGDKVVTPVDRDLNNKFVLVTIE
jgi:4-amino-4-deoxy-L-arabinose transferase-like glycosyltransferase